MWLLKQFLTLLLLVDIEARVFYIFDDISISLLRRVIKTLHLSASAQVPLPTAVKCYRSIVATDQSFKTFVHPGHKIVHFI